MALIDLAVFSSAQQAMVKQRVEQARLFLRYWCDRALPNGAADSHGIRISGALDLTRLDHGLAPVNPESRNGPGIDAAVKRKIAQGETAVIFQGATWGVFWRQPGQFTIIAPATGGPREVSAVAGTWSLEPVYLKLRQIQVLVAGYMVVDLLLLEMLGLYLLGRVTVRPVKRLLRRAETHGEEDQLFAVVGVEEDDYSRLSRALNRIFGRIQQDRQTLASTVERLEIANRELGQAQKDVQRAEKLAAIGRLSAGLAHEIGNPLGIVTGYLDLLRQPDLSDAERDDIVMRTQTEVSRIGRIMRQLLDLARTSPEATATFGVHELVRETAQIFNCQPLTRGIDIRMDLNAAQDCVLADPEKLRQVFLNLMINAADAISATGTDRSGTLTIATENGDGLIRIQFHDNGVGIAPEHLPSIFDPFFTTKAPGKGTGLGLAVSFMIVEAFGGRMAARSQPGQGTTMEVSLPLVPGAAALQIEVEGNH